MELTKRSENYTVLDTLENGQITNGDITVDINSSIRIALSVNKEHNYIGNYNYVLYTENGHVQVHYDISGGNEENTFVNYCESLVDSIINQLQSKSDE